MSSAEISTVNEEFTLLNKKPLYNGPIGQLDTRKQKTH